MNILIEKDELQDVLSLASKFTTSRFTTTTHLQGVLIKGEERLLHFTSTDLNVSFHTKIKVKENTKISIVVEPKKIIEYLSLLPSGKIEVEFKEKNMLIVKDKNRGIFPIMASADFPPVPKLDKEKKQSVKTDFLIKNLALVLFSASSDETRPALTAVNFLTQDQDLIMVSTDGFRLSLVKTAKDINIPQALISGRFLDDVLKEAKNEKEIFLYYSEKEKTILFTVGQKEFYSRLIEGDFPPFEKVIPSESKTKITVDREELLQKVRLVSVFARDYSNIIICEVKKDGIHISPKVDGGIEGSTAFQDAEVDGIEQKIAFNFRFVNDFLSTVRAKKIIIEIFRPDAPVVFKEEGKKNFIHIIMPIRIST